MRYVFYETRAKGLVKAYFYAGTKADTLNKFLKENDFTLMSRFNFLDSVVVRDSLGITKYFYVKAHKD